MATLKDVARYARVSASTVSNALHRRDVVHPETLARIDRAIAELGYVASQSARQLRLGTSKTVTAVMLDAFIPFFAEVARGIALELETAGLDVVFTDSSRTPTRQRRHVEAALERRDRGIILSPAGDVDDLLQSVRKAEMPIVLISPEREYAHVPSVKFDDVGGGTAATLHAIDESGAKEVLFIGDSRIYHSQQRLAGARIAVSNRPGTRLRVQESDGLGLESGTLAAMAYLDSHNPPDAIFCANDMTALGVLQAILARGLKCPDDIGLIGFDDTSIAVQAIVPLTSVRQPARDMGAAAARLLLTRPGHSDSVLFPAHVVVRHSTSHGRTR